MEKYRIAEIAVEMAPRYKTFSSQSVPYIYKGGEMPAFSVEISEESIDSCLEKHPLIDRDIAEYLLSGSLFYNGLLAFDGMMIHASAVEYFGKAYLFSAPCGTGKSTHTSIWTKVFKGARIINDDKPAIRIIGKEVFVYGTPWSGKTDQNLNIKVPLAGICFLSRGEKNEIWRIDPAEAIPLLFEETVRPTFAPAMDALLSVMDKLLRTVPIFKMKCNMDPGACAVSYNAMKGE